MVSQESHESQYKGYADNNGETNSAEYGNARTERPFKTLDLYTGERVPPSLVPGKFHTFSDDV